jgi:hypothetical protein
MQSLAGDFLSDQILLQLQRDYKYNCTPQFRVQRKKNMEVGKVLDPVLRKYQNVTPSFEKMSTRVRCHTHFYFFLFIFIIQTRSVILYSCSNTTNTVSYSFLIFFIIKILLCYTFTNTCGHTTFAIIRMYMIVICYAYSISLQSTAATRRASSFTTPK